jgi:hypothetical protein
MRIGSSGLHICHILQYGITEKHCRATAVGTPCDPLFASWLPA